MVDLQEAESFPSTPGENDSALRALNKGQNLIDIRLTGQFFLDPGNCLAGVELGTPHDPPHCSQGLSPILRKPLALQTDGVRAETPCRPVADNLHEGHAVLRYDTASTEEGVLPHPAKLMDGRQGANGRTITDLDVPRQGRIIGEDYPGPDLTIVGDMSVCHEQAITPDRRQAPTSRGPPMDGHEFPKNVVVANFQLGRFPGIFEILWRSANRTVALKSISGTDRGISRQTIQGSNDAPIAENDAGFND